MAQADPVRDDLTVYSGRAFGPYGWVLRDRQTGAPLRSTEGVAAVAVIKAHPRAAEVLAEWSAQIVEILLPGDEQPVVAAVLTATAEVTAAMTFRTGVYDVIVDHSGQQNPPAVEGRVTVVAAVSG